MFDNVGRKIDYLRISVTDKCNLRCRYCMPKDGIDLISHEELLTLEEIFRLVKIMTEIGITKVRLTGGEPLVRKNLVKLVSDIGSLPEINEISMTTNGVLFADMAEELKNAGLTSVNISLDTLDSDTFSDITGVNAHIKVMESIKKAQELGLPVKINCVPCKELNGNDIEDIALLAKENNMDVRFIELMPLGCGKDFHGISTEDILKRLECRYGKARESDISRGNGPAKYYSFEGFIGKIGFISPMTHKFCSECNRIRLTAEGRLKLCLHLDKGIELKPLLRSKMTDEEIKESVKEAIMEKPKEHEFGIESAYSDKRKMVQIGG